MISGSLAGVSWSTLHAVLNLMILSVARSVVVLVSSTSTNARVIRNTRYEMAVGIY